MKNFFNLSSLFLFVLLIVSCNTDHSTTLEQEVVAVQQRTTNWCDGGATNPPAVYITGASFDPITGYCCVDFRFTSAYIGKSVKLSTTDYNFITMTGNPSNNNSYFFYANSGVTTYCFPEQGSHFLIEVLDGNGNPIACNDFENQCG